MDGSTWIKLHRKIIESQVFNNEGLLKVWLWCLLKASYTERFVYLKTGKAGIEVKVFPGQFVFGKYTAAKELKMDPSTVYKRMQKLKNLGNCNLESNQQYTLVSIINWSVYQDCENNSNRDSNQQVTTKYPASNTNNKDKKVNNEKNKTYSQEFLEFWSAYPSKIGKDAAWKAWSKRNGIRPHIETILSAIQNQKAWREKAGGAFRPMWKNPATWLNQGCWDDECDNGYGADKPSAETFKPKFETSEGLNRKIYG